MVFLGVHFTKRINGTVEAGPNAVLGFSREAYNKLDFSIKDTMDVFTFKGFWKMALKYWKIGLYEQYRSLNKKSFVRSLQDLVPEVTEDDLDNPDSGVRAQAIDKNGKLITSVLNKNILKDIANAGSGKFFHFSNNGQNYTDVNKAIDSMEKKQINSHEYSEFEERFQPLAFISLLLFTTSLVVPTRIKYPFNDK